MSVTFEVEISDKEAKALEEFSSERIEEELVDALGRLAGTEQMRENLRERIGIPESDSDDGEGEELAPDMRMAQRLKEERRSGSARRNR